MEKIKQVVSANGLQIPLTIIEKYGLHQGSDVILTLDDEGIHILPALPDKMEIENRAVRYLLSSLGDSVSVEVSALEENHWEVTVFGIGFERPLGNLVYNNVGELVASKSESIQTMRERALNNYNTE